MSRFFDKLRANAIPTASDWEAHLIGAHKIAPQMTPMAFANYRNHEALNSYQILARVALLNTFNDCLDLGCGDGHFLNYLLPKLQQGSHYVGVDMGPTELAIAQKTFNDTRLRFILARAQELPLENNSIDLVVSHMVIMLMDDLDSLAQELGRILRKNGRFVAVYGAPAIESPKWQFIRKIAFDIIERELPLVRSLHTGDSRIYSREGLEEVFLGQGRFTKVEANEGFTIRVPNTIEDIWSMLKDMYLIGALPVKVKLEIQKAVEAGLQSILPEPFVEYPMRLVSFVT